MTNCPMCESDMIVVDQGGKHFYCPKCFYPWWLDEDQELDSSIFSS
jgi:Zn-finger nucleic acid-binding protein